MAKSIVLFMEMHQPRRLNRLLHYQSPMEPPSMIFDDDLDKLILERVARRSYLKVLSMLEEAHESYGFKFAVGITGILIEQLRMWQPQVLEKLINLIERGVIEPVAETYYHSLAYLIDEDEFREQVTMHVKLIRELTGKTPLVAQNTEFMYSDDVGKVLSSMGFKVILTEGVDRVLGYRQPTYVYRGPDNVKLLLRHYRLSDDVGFRFTNTQWDQYPLTADKYVSWLKATNGDLVMLGLDMETFGEHMPQESGIFEFLRWMFRHSHENGLRFITPSEAIENTQSYDLTVNELISWADAEKDTSAWISNEMQWTAFNQLAFIHELAKSINDEYLRLLVRLLMISDHFYYMTTKHGAPQNVHNYFNPYYSPYRAYTLYQSAIHRAYAYMARVHGNTVISQNLSSIKLPSELASWARGEFFTRARCSNATYTAKLITSNYPIVVNHCVSFIKGLLE